MRYLNSPELAQFHDAFMAMCQKHATARSLEGWGFPTGVIDCDTYSFDTKHGTLYIGHDDFQEKQRWWVPISLEKDQIYVTQLTIAFEMCIPKTYNRYLSVHYVIDADGKVHILHKGKFTIGHSSASMSEFFDYYRKHPGQWTVVNVNFQEYLELGKVSLPIVDNEFLDLKESLAGFADYIPGFKYQYRQVG